MAEDAIDQEHLEKATGGDASLMEELLGMLERELPTRREQLTGSLAGGDFDSAAEAAHRLRGAGSYTGALELERIAGRLEDRLLARDEPGITEAMRELDTHLVRLQEALRDRASLTR